MDTFLTSNERQWRLLRTVVQGALGVIVANIDMLIGRAVLEPAWRTVVVALVMAPLSPVMAKLGTASIKRKGSTRWQMREDWRRGWTSRTPARRRGILALSSISGRCASRIGDAASILEAAKRGLLCRGARACSQRRPSKGNAPLSAGKPSRCSLRLFDSGRRPESGRP